MFETSLKDKVKKIFGLNKATMDSPDVDSEKGTMEQECAFIECETPICRVKDKKEVARVTGKITVFVNAEKMPMDYFSKRIDMADPADKKDLFFFEIGHSKGRFMNLDERTISFVYLYQAQYDPNQGQITSIEIAEGGA